MHNDSPFAGDLGFVALADLFQILGGNNSTGALRLKSPYTWEDGLIYFLNGNPVNATFGSLLDLEAIRAIFGLTEGRFEFRDESVRPREPRIRQGRMQIVLDALRMLDDGHIKRIGPPSFVDVPESRERAKEEDSFPVVKGPLIDYMHVINEERFRDGERIATQGCYGNWVWVILEGNVKITKETDDGPLVVAQLGQGCFIGMVTSFLFTESVRSANVTAVGDVHLGMLDTERLSGEYAALSADFRKVLYSLSGRLRKVTDRTVDLFLGHDGRESATRSKGQLLENAFSDVKAYAIDRGESIVMCQGDKGTFPLLRLGEEDVFGSMPFVDMGHEPLCACVCGSGDLRVRELNGKRLTREYDRLSGTLKNMIENMSTCVSLTTRLARRLAEDRMS